MKILAGEVQDGDTVEVDAGDDGLTFKVLEPASAAGST
jgi:hypothetical protein